MGIELEAEYEQRKAEVLYAVSSAVERYRLDVSDTVKENLAIHLTLSITRQLSGNYISTSQSQLEQCKNLDTYLIARELVKGLAAKYDVIMHHIDYYYTAMYLAGMSLLDLDFDCEFDMFDEEMEEVMDETLDEIRNRLHLDLRQNPDFCKHMTLHFFPALERLENNEQLEANPLVDELSIKDEEEYSCAMILNEIVEKHYHKSFNRHELCYISLHFGTALYGIDKEIV